MYILCIVGAGNMDCNANTFLKDSRYAKDKTGPLENFTNTCSVNHILHI